TRSARGLTPREMFPYGETFSPGLLRLWQSTVGSPFAFGLTALVLVPAALLAPGWRVLGAWALALAAVSGIWSIGASTSFFGLYLALPAMRLFRLPFRQLFVTNFAVAIAAALGLSAVTRDDGAGSSRAPRMVALALMAIGLAGVLVLVRRGWPL